MNLDFATFVFDCDGVVLNSNHVKTEAFYKAVLPYGKLSAEAFIDYHKKNGGVSRYKKFAYFLEHLAPSVEGPSLDEMLKDYANMVVEGLLTCELASGLHELREQTSHAGWMIVSGGDQDELREVFKVRGLDSLFDQGIYGSPDTKEVILQREKSLGRISHPSLFIGDSIYDHVASSASGLDFVFLTNWTDVSGWQAWASANKINTLGCLRELL